MFEYLKIFMDDDKPDFIDKYLLTKSMQRLKYVTQFCGCDYTKLYNPLFLYTRYDHSLVVAYMTYHFTHDKKETIAALLHDVGTPCFAHSIDYVFGDYINQESSEKNIIDIINSDKELLLCLKNDNISLDDISNLSKFPVLENKSPRLCTDRLDGVLHTNYIWLHTHNLEQIKHVYDNLTVLKNEDNLPEIGFKDYKCAEEFVMMVYNYAKELQSNTDKYIMKYVSEIVKLAFNKKLITLEDLYTMPEENICNIFSSNFSSWQYFNEASELICTDVCPKDNFYISFSTKKRNTIPLVNIGNESKRIVDVSETAKDIYDLLNNLHEYKYAYVKTIKHLK